MTDKLEQNIIESYKINASAWADIIANEGIESRKLVTNKAIVDAILSHRPDSVLDVGCGEGWLVRAMVSQGINAMGIDGVAELIDEAKKQNCGEFAVCDYHQINQCTALKNHYDVIVCNFALLGKQSTNAMLSSCANLLPNNSLLASKARIIIQTLHPCFANPQDSYQDGWQQGSWAGFPSSFTQPPDWYFRTLQSWIALFNHCGLVLSNIIEPINPQTNQPASIIFECSKGK